MKKREQRSIDPENVMGSQIWDNIKGDSASLFQSTRIHFKINILCKSGEKSQVLTEFPKKVIPSDEI